MGTASSCGAGAHRLVAAPGVEHLEGDQQPERAGGCAHETGAVTGDGVDRHPRQVGEVREEGAERHVLAEGHPVDLLEHADDVAVGPPGHDLVAEGGGGRGLGDADEEGRVEPPGQPAQERRLRGARQRAVERHHVFGPQDEPGEGRAVATADVAASWAAKTVRGRDLLLAQAPLPAALDQGDAQRPDGRPAIGCHRADHDQCDEADDDRDGPDDRRARRRGCGARPRHE